MHFTAFPLPGLPFHCQPHTAPGGRVVRLEMPITRSWMDVPPCQGPTPLLTLLCMENLPWAMAGPERGATGGWKTPQEESRGNCRVLSSARGRTGVTLQDPPQLIVYLPPAPSQQLPPPQKHQTSGESRESTTNSSSTASPTGSGCQHRALNGPIWETGNQNPTGSAQQSCPCSSSRAVPGGSRAVPASPPCSKGTYPGTWSCRNSPAPARIPCRHRRNTPEPSRVTTTALGQVLHQRDSQGALGPSSLPAQLILLVEQL